MVVNLQNTVPGLRSLGGRDSLDNLSQDASQMQDSFGRWINYIIADSPGSVDDQTLESSISDGYQPFNPPMNDNHGSSVSGQIFNITDVSPVWGLSNEETKVLLHVTFTYYLHESNKLVYVLLFENKVKHIFPPCEQTLIFS